MTGVNVPAPVTLKASEWHFSSFTLSPRTFGAFKSKNGKKYYLLTNWLACLYGRIQSPRPDVMPDRREGIKRAAGFVFACTDTQAS